MKIKSIVSAVLVLAAAASGLQAAAAAPRAIKVVAGANNEMKFDQTALTATQGEEITLTLVNESTQPKMVMGHNLVILKPGTDVTDFALDAAGAVATEYIPDSMKASVVASTKLLGPKESATVTFKVPAVAGEYPFLCSFPGHFGTMVGKLTVK